MVSFKVGDIVIATCDFYNGCDITFNGQIGKIIEISGLKTACVQFNNNIDGHNGDGLGKQGHCWWGSIQGLKLYNNRITELRKRIIK